MKLNVGSEPKGQYRGDGWVCLDINPEKRPHVVGSGFALPFADCSFEEVRSIHVLEHLTRDQWPIMLAEMFRVLDEGGTFYVEVPDFEVQCRRYLGALAGFNTEQIHVERTGIWGKTERVGMAHHFGFDVALLRSALNKIGFQAIKHLDERPDMISAHFKQGPIILMRATKTDYRSPVDVRELTFDQLREYIIK